MIGLCFGDGDVFVIGKCVCCGESIRRVVDFDCDIEIGEGIESCEVCGDEVVVVDYDVIRKEVV